MYVCMYVGVSCSFLYYIQFIVRVFKAKSPLETFSTYKLTTHTKNQTTESNY